MDVSDLRRDYRRSALDERDLAPEPIAQFRAWLAEALAADPLDPTAMTLATADREGRPSARVVLLKGYDERGFVFFTNYASRKAQELLANPRAALVFYWPAFDRQVRAEGTVAKTSRDETAAYFATRPLASRLGAWASRQSAPVAGRGPLEQAFAAAAERFAGQDVPAPDFWGGYRLSPTWVEFWQGRESRLHDRLAYRRDASGGWTVERLQP
ncbi:MAG: pyridoxamine 5'-phosphate oxidase [Acidobacteria bacterium]|nr:pyridoxamine 5'-phosphate oxidase [Acidobacteriota bacterium]